MPDRNAILKGGNRLKLGLFGSNVSSGRSYTHAPDRWDASWEHNLELAQLADEAGLECLVPIARWKGYGGETNPNGASWESTTWAAGLLAATKRINVFATVHVPLNHPIVAAKQLATTDHISSGRLGLNIVCGWNEDEFRMFGVTKKEHEARYAQGAEWWSIVRGIWAGGEPFDFEGEHYQIKGAVGSPLPFGDQAPLMMNAGGSPSGRAFAIRYSDMHFEGMRSPEESRLQVAASKAEALANGRSIQVWTPIGVVCRPTEKEADDYSRYLVANADRQAVGNLFELEDRGYDGVSPEDRFLHRTQESPERRVIARGNFCAIGDPDSVAYQLQRLSEVGFDGIVINFANYLKEFPYFAQEVLPRLVTLGVRTEHPPSGLQAP